MALLVVSTGGASEVATSTVTAVPPGFTVKTNCVLCPIATVTFSYLASPNPLAAVVTTSYVPGGTCNRRKNPSSLVVIVRLKPAPEPVVVVALAVSFAVVIVKVKLGTTAPAASLTEPSILPVVSCPRATVDRQRTSEHRSVMYVILFFIFYSFRKFASR